MDPQYRNVMSKLIIGPDPTEIIGPVRRTDFDNDFLFGSATSAYQVEGAAKVDGRGPSNWDSFTTLRPEKITDGLNGDVAIDQYHLYKDDVQLMKKTGLEAYRFSISWSRILPDGKLNAGINKEGIKYYNNLIDELLSEGIEPCVTLFHWDIPLALELEYRGFLSRDIVKDFVDYAELCFWEFGDRVKNWITFNEGWTYVVFGYVQGNFPPGRGGSTVPELSKNYHCCHKGAGAHGISCSDGNAGTEPYIAAHNMILAHGYAVDMYKKNFQENQGGKIGITNVSYFFEPLNNTQEDQNAAIRGLDWMLGWFTAPIATGDYPPNMRKTVKDRLPQFHEDEKKILNGSYDFLGINYYTTRYAKPAPKLVGVPPTYETDQGIILLTERHGIPIGEQTGGASWEYMVPRGIYNLLVYTKMTYNINLIYITENGCSEKLNASLPLSKAREDPIRIKYYREHLWYVKKAIREAGVNVKAYFLWSLFDNFEWADGYTYRFGTFYIDYTNGKLTRYPKLSAIWWRNFFNKKLIKSSSKREARENENEYDLRKKHRPNNP